MRQCLDNISILLRCHLQLAQGSDTNKIAAKMLANKACTGRWGFCRIFKHFSGFEFFLLPNIVHARPPASNANR